MWCSETGSITCRHLSSELKSWVLLTVLVAEEIWCWSHLGASTFRGPSTEPTLRHYVKQEGIGCAGRTMCHEGRNLTCIHISRQSSPGTWRDLVEILEGTKSIAAGRLWESHPNICDLPEEKGNRKKTKARLNHFPTRLSCFFPYSPFHQEGHIWHLI